MCLGFGGAALRAPSSIQPRLLVAPSLCSPTGLSLPCCLPVSRSLLGLCVFPWPERGVCVTLAVDPAGQLDSLSRLTLFAALSLRSSLLTAAFGGLTARAHGKLALTRATSGAKLLSLHSQTHPSFLVGWGLFIGPAALRRLPAPLKHVFHSSLLFREPPRGLMALTASKKDVGSVA